MSSENIFDKIINFLFCKTPQEWLEKAQNNISLLVIDHAHCEKKAASTALSLIAKYPNHTSLIERLSCLAREELTHFEKVLKRWTRKLGQASSFFKDKFIVVLSC